MIEGAGRNQYQFMKDLGILMGYEKIFHQGKT